MASVNKRKWTHKGVTKEAWAVRYFDAKGVRRSKNFNLKKDADAFKRKAEREIEDGTHVAASESVTVGALSDQYLATLATMTKEGTMAVGTLKKEQFYFESHILPQFRGKLLRDLQPNDVDAWIISLKTGKLRGQGRLQPASIKQLQQAFARAVDFGKRRGFVGRNVVREVGQWSEHRKGRNEPIRTFTIEEAKQLLASVQHRDLGLTAKRLPRARPGWTRRSEALARCFSYLASMCGLRLGEAMGLTGAHVDFEKGVIRVRHSLDAWDNLKGPKTSAGVRDVPMPSIVAIEVQAWLHSHYVANDRSLIFRTDQGGRISTASFHRNIWQPALEEAGLGPDSSGRRFHYHALRHFYASMLINGRMPLPDVARLLGHASFDMTLQVYTHALIPEATTHSVIEAMAGALRGATVTQRLLTA